MIINDNYDTKKRLEGDSNLYISNFNSKTYPIESIDVKSESIEKTMSLSILSKQDINVDLKEIIAFYDQIDHKLFDNKKCYSVLRSEQLYYDNIDQIRNQRIVLQANNQSAIFQGFIEENRQLIVQKIITVYSNDVLVQKFDEYKIHHLINQQYPKQSLQLINPVQVKKTQQYYQLIALMEKASFNLFEYSRKHKITSEQAHFIFKTILKQIIAIHKLKIAHRDIKPQNILFVQDKGWLITDFGESQEYDEVLSFYSIRGTKFFLIPSLQLQINKKNKVEQNLLENDLYALVVTIIMIQSNEYIRDMEMKVKNVTGDHLIQILKVKSLEELIIFTENYFKEQIQVNFITAQPIYKAMNVVEEETNTQLTYISWIRLLYFYRKIKINTQLCLEIVQLINKCKLSYKCNPCEIQGQNLNYLAGIDKTIIDPLYFVRIKKCNQNSIQLNEQIISLLFLYGYNEKTIFYAKQILANTYSQYIHLFLILSYQRIHMFREADQELLLFNQGLLFDEINTNSQERYFFLLASQRNLNENQNVSTFDMRLNQQLNHIDFISWEKDIYYIQDDKQQQTNNENEKNLADKLLTHIIQACSLFNINNINQYILLLNQAEKSLPIHLYIKLLKKISNSKFELIDLNRQAILIYILGQSYLYLNENGKKKLNFKQFQKLILKSDSWQQIISFQIYILTLKIFQLQGDLQKHLTKIKFLLDQISRINLRQYKQLILQYLFHLISFIYKYFDNQYNTYIIHIVQYCFSLAIEQLYLKREQNQFNGYHIAGQNLLLNQRNWKRCKQFVKEYQVHLNHLGLGYMKSYKEFTYKKLNKQIYSKKGRSRQFLREQYFYRL